METIEGIWLEGNSRHINKIKISGEITDVNIEEGLLGRILAFFK